MWETVNGGFAASTMIPQHHTGSIFTNFTPTCTCDYSLRVHPYAHPQHLKVLKQVLYFQYECGIQSTGGLQPQPSYHIVFWAQPFPNFPNFAPTCTCNYGQRVHPYAHPQHLKLLKHFVYIQYECGMQSAVLCSLNHDTTTHTPGSAISHIP